MNNLFKILLISGVSYMIGKRDGFEKSKAKSIKTTPTFRRYDKVKTAPPTVNSLSYDDYNTARDVYDRVLKVASLYDYVTLGDLKEIASLGAASWRHDNWGWFRRDLEGLVIQTVNYYKDLELCRSYTITFPEIKYIREVL